MTHGPSTGREREEKARLELELEPWQLEGCVVWPLLYAGLGKTRECGASEVSGLPHQDTSSTMNLFLFFFYIFLYWKDLSWPFFISLLLSSFLSYHSVLTFLCFVLKRDERKIYMLAYIVHDYVVFSPFCPFWLYFFTAATCLRARIPCQWFGWMTTVNIYWVKYLHPYALKTFMGPSKRNYVHEKYFLWVSASNFVSK